VGADQVLVDHGLEIVLGELFHLGNLMGSTESVEEVNKGMRDSRLAA